MYRIIFIGSIKENRFPQGGEEYKNQLILSKLKSEQIDLKYFDTISWKNSPLLIFRLFYDLLFREFDAIVISASSVSTYRFLKIIHFLRPKILNKISYSVIGGYFPEALETKRFNPIVYEKLKCIIVEGNSMKSQISNHLFSVSIEVVTNFKKFPQYHCEYIGGNKIFRFVFLGRICEPKGVGIILKASKIIMTGYPDLNFIIDFWGPKEEEYIFNEICRYRGYLDFSNNSEKVYADLNSYNCFLFPTTWRGEGFPGVVIDAYVAGLPIIATDWNMNTEIIKDGINGFIIPPNDIEALVEKMVLVMRNRNQCRLIGSYNREESKRYHIDKVWDEFYAFIK